MNKGKTCSPVRHAAARTAALLTILFAVPAPHAEQPGHRYDSIAITAPSDDSTVFDNNGHVTVQVRVLPESELAPGDRVELLFDEYSAMSGQGKELSLEHVDRGPHRLQARIVDKNDDIVVESAPVTFYLWQASRNFPSRNR